ncbi:MAG: FG-GAP-like repeat-containing protein [Syntrophobacter sp.]
MSIRKVVFLFPLYLFLLSFIIPISSVGAQTEAPVKVAILPFTMHTPAELHYLQSGVRDMLTSRLAWQGKVQVMDRSSVEQAAKGAKDITINDALRIGNSLRADYVLFGSITGMGQSVSIDAKMAAVSGKGEPVSFFAQTKNLDDVVPQINQFAQQINQKVFSKPGEQTQASAADAEMLATRNPELLLPGALVSGDKISYINPNFIEVTPDGAMRQPGLWRSQTFPGAIIGMDVGDLDGDGRSEIVAITRGKLTVYRKESQGLRILGTFEAGAVNRFVWVCVADIYKDGKAYIYLTSLKRKNVATGSVDRAKVDVNSGEDVSSYVLSLSGGKLQVVADKIPYFLNTAYMGKRGKVLVGQQKGAIDDVGFKGAIMEMQLRGNSLSPLTPVQVPDRCTVFNFAKADINGDKMDETIAVDDSHRLLVLNAAGEQIWRAVGLFCATTNTFEAKVEDRRYNLVELYAIPSPIIVTDLNKDGIPEIVLNRTTTPLDKFLPDSMKSWDKGEIVSLSWDQMGMIENWKTRDLSGMVTSIRVGDLNGDGRNQLVISMVLAKDLLKVGDLKSTIFSYDLNVNPNAVKKDAATAPAAASQLDNETQPKPRVPGRSSTKK